MVLGPGRGGFLADSIHSRRQLLEAPLLASMRMHVAPNDLVAVDQEPARHHPRIADRPADTEAARLQARQEHARSEQLAHARTAQTEAGVEPLVGIGDGTRLRPALFEEGVPLSRGAQVHQEQRRQVSLPVALLELREVTPAERSSEVPQEDDQSRAFGEIVAQGRADQVAAIDRGGQQLRREFRVVHGELG